VLNGLDHIAIRVEDLQAATRTYTVLLGRSPAWRGEQPAEGTANAIFRLRNTSVALVATGAELAGAAEGRRRGPARPHAEAAGEGLAALAFGTDDAEAAVATCCARGLDVGPPVAGLSHDTDSGAFRRYETLDLPSAQTGGVPLHLVAHRSPEALLQPGPLCATPEAAAASLDHVVVMTPAPERAIALYRDQLGIRLALDRSFEARGVRLLFFRTGGTTIEVGASLAADPAKAPRAPGEDRLFGAAYRVDDLDAARARLVETGVDVSGVRAGHKPGTRVFTVKGETHGVPTLVIGDD